MSERALTGQPSKTDEYREATQAEYLRSVYSTFEPVVDKIFFYELKDGRWVALEKENHFGLLTFEGAKKETYDIVKNICKNQESK